MHAHAAVTHLDIADGNLTELADGVGVIQGSGLLTLQEPPGSCCPRYKTIKANLRPHPLLIQHTRSPSASCLQFVGAQSCFLHAAPVQIAAGSKAFAERLASWPSAAPQAYGGMKKPTSHG